MSETATAETVSATTEPPATAATPPAPAAKPKASPQVVQRGAAPDFSAAIAKARAAAIKITSAPEPKPAPAAEVVASRGPDPAAAGHKEATTPPGDAPKTIDIKLPDEIVKKITSLESELRGMKKAPDKFAEAQALFKSDPKKALAMLAGKPDAESEVVDLLASHYMGAAADAQDPATRLEAEIKALKEAETARGAREAEANSAAERRAAHEYIGGILDHNQKKYPRLARPEVRAEAVEMAHAKAAQIASARGLTKDDLGRLSDTEVAALADEGLAATEEHYAKLASRWGLTPSKEPAKVEADTRSSTREAPQTQAPPIKRPAVTTAEPKKRLSVAEATAKAKEAARALIGQ